MHNVIRILYRKTDIIGSYTDSLFCECLTVFSDNIFKVTSTEDFYKSVVYYLQLRYLFRWAERWLTGMVGLSGLRRDPNQLVLFTILTNGPSCCMLIVSSLF
jgi:hypothetical protein